MASHLKIGSWGSLYWHGLTLIPAWISNYTSITRCGIELLIHSQLPLWSRWSVGMEFHATLYWACDYLLMLGLKLNHVLSILSWLRQRYIPFKIVVALIPVFTLHLLCWITKLSKIPHYHMLCNKDYCRYSLHYLRYNGVIFLYRYRNFIIVVYLWNAYSENTEHPMVSFSEV